MYMYMFIREGTATGSCRRGRAHGHGRRFVFAGLRALLAPTPRKHTVLFSLHLGRQF